MPLVLCAVRGVSRGHTKPYRYGFINDPMWKTSARHVLENKAPEHQNPKNAKTTISQKMCPKFPIYASESGVLELWAALVYRV